MDSLRTFFLQHRALASMLVAAALLLKVLVPSGLMIEADAAHTITVAICHNALGDAPAQQISIPAKKGEGETPGSRGKGECPYAALSMVSLSGADIVLLAIALAFIVALGFRPSPAPSRRRSLFILPPLRGPPALI